MKMMKMHWMLLLFSGIFCLGMTSCADAEDGESKDDWDIRNALSTGIGSWQTGEVKIDGVWYEDPLDGLTNPSPLYFTVKFSASKKTFESRKFYYKDGGEMDRVADESTSQSYKGTYTLENRVLVATRENGEKYFSMSILEKPSSVLHANVTFHDVNKTYEMKLHR